MFGFLAADTLLTVPPPFGLSAKDDALELRTSIYPAPTETPPMEYAAPGEQTCLREMRWTRLNLTVVGFSCWRAFARTA